MTAYRKLRPFFFIAIIIISSAAHSISEASCAYRKIKINPAIELNFKTKKEIYAIRSRCVFKHRQLLQGKYKPSDSVFAQILDKKPWWGTLGLSYYGPGFQSIEGVSEESRFLVNPFLFVGLKISHGLIVKDKNVSAIAIYPQAVSLLWNKNRSFAKVKYDVSGYWQKLKDYAAPQLNDRSFLLIAYNARDFGFNYLYIDPEKSENILSAKASSAVMPIQQMIRCDGACGYPGGCNNVSSHQPGMLIDVDSTPALVYIKLWKKEPKDSGEPPDMAFVIEMV